MTLWCCFLANVMFVLLVFCSCSRLLLFVIFFFILVTMYLIKSSLVHRNPFRGEVCPHKISITLPPFIEVPVQIQKSERLCIYMLEVSMFPLSTNFLLDPILWYFFSLYQGLLMVINMHGGLYEFQN